jgi:hypothetical protein
VQWSYYCSRCRRFVSMHPTRQSHYINALKEAWSAKEDGFLCHYTGARVDDDDPESPWYLSFDHRVPGDVRTLVVAAWWVNAMKHALSEEGFWAVVKEYTGT